ncbi:MAG: serine/threonine-protein phosphatase [Candidatus Krumholzibacteria bacterium]|nr:serine/threonine-protein phosphatase [Candidatus Krumholzibacteria bacterium]
MHKHLYRTVENLLDRIDNSAGDEKMLVDILHLLVESDDTAAFGVVSGRLYMERELDYILIKSISGHGPQIAGKTISKEYQVVKDILRHRLWIISPESPGWDPELEAQFSDVDSAAILVGRDPSYIMSLGIRHHGSEDDLLVLLESIRASIGLKLRQQVYVNQMKQAQAIQHSLLPRRLPTLEGFEIAAVSHPAEEVGGDVYDVQHVGGGTIGLMLADASGHGLPAALQARDVVIGMRMGQAEGEKITTTISRLNRVIHSSGLTSRFISLFYAELEESGNLAYVNGGHCPPLLVSNEGEVFELKTCGPVLGPLPDAAYRRGYATLKPGEVMVMFTDGVTEREDPKSKVNEDDIVELGRDGLIKTIQDCHEESAEEIADRIIERVRDFGNGRPFEDDVSVMVVKRLAANNYPPAEDLTLVSSATRR